MDYELKRVITFCLIVKLVALSSEFSIKPQTETFNQGSDTLNSPQLMSLAAIKEPWETSMDEKNQGVHFNMGPGGKKSNDREFNKKPTAKSDQIRINSALETCEHMAELLETSKWRGIQKTLHWLDRVLASSNTLRRCRRKLGKTKPKLLNKMQNFESPKTISKRKSYFEMKKFSGTGTIHCRKNVINSLTSYNNSEQSERLKNECERKNKFGKNKRKHLYQKKSRHRTKDPKYYRKKILEKRRHNSGERSAKPNNAVTQSKNIFSNSDKLYYAEKKKEMEIFGDEKFYGRKSGSEKEEKIYNDSERRSENAEEGAGRENNGKTTSYKWPTSLELRKSDGKIYKKENPWPNFVYHRVSSDLFHLGSTASNHKQSAYVAISVNTSGEPDAVRNKNKIFKL